jgi:hypothetical protein
MSADGVMTAVYQDSRPDGTTGIVMTPSLLCAVRPARRPGGTNR